MTTGNTQRLRVVKYIPQRMYGFLAESEAGPQYFFHLRVFHPGEPAHEAGCLSCAGNLCSWVTSAPPPIIGESVKAVLEPDPENPYNIRAARVERLAPPVPILGNIDTFDAPRGYGFIRGRDGRSYYLHRSEVIEGRIPLAGQPVVFFAAERRDKARACHVKICPEG